MTELEQREAAERFVRDGKELYTRILGMVDRNPRGLLLLLYAVHGLRDHIPGLYTHTDNVSYLVGEWIMAGCPDDTEEFLKKLGERPRPQG